MSIFTEKMLKNVIKVNGKEYIPVNILLTRTAYFKKHVKTSKFLSEYFESKGIPITHKESKNKQVQLVSMDYRDQIDKLYLELAEKYRKVKKIPYTLKSDEPLNIKTDTEDEFKVVMLLLTGTSYEDISRALGVDSSFVRNTVAKYSFQISHALSKMPMTRHLLSDRMLSNL